MKLLEEYLNQLQYNVVVTEGATQAINKVLAAVGMGKPREWTFLSGKTPYKLFKVHYEKCLDLCAKIYRQEIEKAEEEITTDMMKLDGLLPGKEEAVDRAERVPSLGYCELNCKVELLKNLVNMMKNEPEKICSKNINKNLCLRWVEKNLPALEIELKYIESVAKVYKKGRKYREADIKRIRKAL